MIPERVQIDDFTEFVKGAEPQLRVALCSAFGIEAGRKATGEALPFAWEHWDRVSRKDNPAELGRPQGSKAMVASPFQIAAKS